MNDSTVKQGEGVATGITHLCVGCGNLVPMCTCDPTGGKEHESVLAFRQETRARLKRIEQKLDQIIEDRCAESEMTTTVDSYGVCHIDGPPVTAFAIAENSDGSGNRVEVIYRLIKFYGTREECEDAWGAILDLIRAELKDLCVAQLVPRLTHPIIWWRRRPEYIQEERVCHFSCRLATSPPLPDTFWQRWETPDGKQGRPANEVI